MRCLHLPQASRAENYHSESVCVCVWYGRVVIFHFIRLPSVVVYHAPKPNPKAAIDFCQTGG